MTNKDSKQPRTPPAKKGSKKGRPPGKNTDSLELDLQGLLVAYYRLDTANRSDPEDDQEKKRTLTVEYKDLAKIPVLAELPRSGNPERRLRELFDRALDSRDLFEVRVVPTFPNELDPTTAEDLQDAASTPIDVKAVKLPATVEEYAQKLRMPNLRYRMLAKTAARALQEAIADQLRSTNADQIVICIGSGRAVGFAVEAFSLDRGHILAVRPEFAHIRSIAGWSAIPSQDGRLHDPDFNVIELANSIAPPSDSNRFPKLTLFEYPLIDTTPGLEPPSPTLNDAINAEDGDIALFSLSLLNEDHFFNKLPRNPRLETLSKDLAEIKKLETDHYGKDHEGEPILAHAYNRFFPVHPDFLQTQPSTTVQTQETKT